MTLLAELAQEHEFDAGNCDALASNLRAVHTLSVKRNLIAHNPLTLVVFGSSRHDDEAMPTFSEVIVAEEDVHLTLGELQAAAMEASRPSQVLHQNE